MKRAIECRELFELESVTPTIRGTYHKPPCRGTAALSGAPPLSDVGILFLNGLYAPRSSNGDAAVYWAESFATCGYHCFRVDLPGYGDSDGDAPEDWLDFINRGGYALSAAAAMKELISRFRLSGVIIIGHCGGAVSAIYAAAAADSRCLGLVLMDPYFHMRQEATASIRQSLRVWALRSRWGRRFSKLFDLLKQSRLLLRSTVLPENANFELLRCWKSLASGGLPILLLKAPSRGSTGIKPRMGEFDYFQHVLELSGRKNRVVVKIMDGANHSFSNHVGRNAVRESTEHWLKEYFPLSGSGQCTWHETTLTPA